MVAPEQNAQHKRRERVGRDKPAHFRLQKSKRALIAKHEQELSYRQLHQDRSENEQDPRVLRKSAGLIDPELRHCNSQKQERDDEILRWFRLLAAKDKERQSGSERDKDKYFDVRSALEAAQQIVARAPPSYLSRGQTTSNQPLMFREIEHFIYDPDSAARDAADR